MRDNHFDKKFRVRTAVLEVPRSLEASKRPVQDAGEFGASPPLAFHLILSSLQIPYEEYTFIDIGSSKGRALLMASEYPFEQIIGLELAEELHKAAIENISSYRSRTQKCLSIHSRLQDANEFDFPMSPLFVYLFNPMFGDGVFTNILQRLQRSFDDQPRHIIIVYFNPTRKALLDDLDFLEPVPFEDHMRGLARKLMPRRHEGDGDAWVAIYETKNS
jgi:SAM-dependent methyltransferase